MTTLERLIHENREVRESLVIAQEALRREKERAEHLVISLLSATEQLRAAERQLAEKE